jgi:hypothetical protein
MLLAQLPAPAPGAIENWLVGAAAVGSLALLAKKLLGRKAPEGDFVTKTEFHQEITAVRDKIDAHFLALTEKIEHLGVSIHGRLNQLESGLARVDERTKK